MDWMVTLLLLGYTLKTTLAVANGVVLPNDPYIYIGNNLTLMCNLTRYNTDYHSQFLTFSRHNDEVIPFQYIEVTGTRSIVLRYPIQAPGDEGNYICKLNRTSGRPEIIGNQFVRVEYKPRPVTEMNCRVHNWENMTCTWDLGVQFVSPKTIDIKLIWTTSGDQFECPHQTMTTCSWWALDEEDSFMSDLTYMMGVSITNTRTSEMFPLQTIKVDTSKIVEPARVSELRGNSNSSCVMVSWRHEKVNRDKVYQVEFKTESDQVWKTKHVGDEEGLTLCGLMPNTEYLFNVTCKPRIMGKVRGFWSKENIIRVKTKEGIPTRAPELAAGSYIEQPCHQTCKKVVLFWQPLDASNAGGEVDRYWLNFSNLNTGSFWENLSVAGNNYQGTLLLMAGNDYMIRIQAATKVGLSRVFSQILIPAKEHKPPVPEVIVEGHNQSYSTVVTVRWEHPRIWTSKYWQNLTSYTVFWCRGSRIPLSCHDSIQWREVPIIETGCELLVDALDTYLFGVSVNTLNWAGQRISSGIQWNSCIYIKNIKPEVAPSNVRLSSYQPDKGLSVEWDRLTCGDTHAYIQHYIISICPSNQGSNCTGEHTTYTVENTATGSHYTVIGLKRDGRYKVWLNAAAEGGISPNSDHLFGVVVDRSLNPGEITGIVIGALFVIIIFLFGIILCTRRAYRVVKQRYFMPVPIEIPSTLPPLPPIPMPPRQLSHDSDSSDTIYAKIDGPPSPCSSTDSNAGVEAPLIHHKWKLANLKSHIYGSKKEQRDGNDSGRGSLSHSADTLLMRLHPSHLRRSKNKKMKEKLKSESDSGVITDSRNGSRGQVAVAYENNPSDVVAYSDNQSYLGFQEYYQGDYQSHSCVCTKDQSNSAMYGGDQVKVEKNSHAVDNTGEVNPYSCVDIVDQINSASEKLKRKISPGALPDQFCDALCPGIKQSNNGSTLSLPPACQKGAELLSQSMDFRTKSADNKLDLEERKLSCMSEKNEYESSDASSEDGTLDSVEDIEHETSSSGSSSQQPMTSYIKFMNGETLEPRSDGTKSTLPSFNIVYDCDCKSKGPVLTSDGYLTEAALKRAPVCTCAKGEQTVRNEGQSDINHTANIVQDAEIIKSGLRPVSQVLNFPPHFYGSMSTVPVDPSNTTEL